MDLKNIKIDLSYIFNAEIKKISDALWEKHSKGFDLEEHEKAGFYAGIASLIIEQMKQEQ